MHLERFRVQVENGLSILLLPNVVLTAFSFEKAGTIITSRRCPSDERERTDCAVVSLPELSNEVLGDISLSLFSSLVRC